jgi:hypothetical protein
LKLKKGKNAYCSFDVYVNVLCNKQFKN